MLTDSSSFIGPLSLYTMDSRALTVSMTPPQELGNGTLSTAEGLEERPDSAPPSRSAPKSASNSEHLQVHKQFALKFHEG